MNNFSFRVVKSKGVSLVDATAMWYLSVLASTAEATLPLAPHLRQQIIAHTRYVFTSCACCLVSLQNVLCLITVF